MNPNHPNQANYQAILDLMNQQLPQNQAAGGLGGKNSSLGIGDVEPNNNTPKIDENISFDKQGIKKAKGVALNPQLNNTVSIGQIPKS